MGEQVKLLPCPFCEGPPVPIVRTDALGAVYPEHIPEAGLCVEAYVFCHECGAHGPRIEQWVYDMDEVEGLRREAVKLWQQRDNRHRRLYDGGEAEGLNLFPRADENAGGPEIDPAHTEHCKRRLLHGDGVCECGLEERLSHG